MANKVLVAVFSASGVTKRVGHEIARISGGDFFEIVPAEKYTNADLNYMNSRSRSEDHRNIPGELRFLRQDNHSVLHIGRKRSRQKRYSSS